MRDLIEGGAEAAATSFQTLRHMAGSDIAFTLWGCFALLVTLFVLTRLTRLMTARRKAHNATAVRTGKRYDTDAVRSLRKARETDGGGWS
ncbi:hypothetical protein FHS89_001722 [Rubricella aquisinus]|uniref:Heme exporter protein D n=1 Tax=Rubricella aquisinus TaxID=2028108 RepID=A0A840WPW9_9RHOB|nr:hypothetical protein [Rubricella aquisinus]MBB5515702.1 hypothetical protein [Rubricella aquisinus]